MTRVAKFANEIDGSVGYVRSARSCLMPAPILPPHPQTTDQARADEASLVRAKNYLLNTSGRSPVERVAE